MVCMVRYAQKCLVVGRAARPGERNHPLAQRGSLLPQAGIERAPVALGHPQVTQHHVIARRLERGAGVPAIARGLHHRAVPLEYPGQHADQAQLIVADHNAPRSVRSHALHLATDQAWCLSGQQTPRRCVRLLLGQRGGTPITARTSHHTDRWCTHRQKRAAGSVESPAERLHSAHTPAWPRANPIR
jgi:hypothetical protein